MKAEMISQSNSTDLATGYRNCRLAVNKTFARLRWITSNLPGPQRRDLDPLLNHLVGLLDLLDLQSADGLSLDIWFEIRDDLDQAFSGQAGSMEMAALMDVVERYQIPKQLFFDSLNGADLWIRQNRFATYEELALFTAKVGGSAFLSMIPVLGPIKPHYESSAVACAKAIMLTELLANLVSHAKENRVFLAEEDLQSCEIEIQRLKLRKPSPTLKHLVRLYCWRIDQLLNSGSKLLGHLDFDGRRSVTSLLGWTWKTMNQMRLSPESLLSETGVLTRHDMFKLKAKHLLGLEGNLPFQIETDDHH